MPPRPRSSRAILAIRDKRGWGAREIHKKLADDPTIEVAPSTDSVNRILRREGRITPGKPRRRRKHAGPPIPILPERNGTWTADFKGESRTQDGKLCFPLNVQDGYARSLLECRALLSTEVQATMRRFRYLFRTFGLPRRIRSDNGSATPFSSLSRGQESDQVALE